MSTKIYNNNSNAKGVSPHLIIGMADMINDKNMMWCGLINIIGIAIEFAIFAVLCFMPESTAQNDLLLKIVSSYVPTSVALLSWAFLAFSSVKMARILAFGLVVPIVSLFWPGGPIFVVALLIQLVLSVLLVVLVANNDGVVRRALGFFLAAALVSVPGLAMEHFLADEWPEFSKVVAAFPRIFVVAGSLTLLFDVGCSPKGARQPERVPLHWRLFVLAVPLIAMPAFSPHVKMLWTIVFPFCLSFVLMIGDPLVFGLMFVVWSLVGLVSLVVVACATNRKMFQVASAVFIIEVLLNIVGGALFFNCFQLGGVH